MCIPEKYLHGNDVGGAVYRKLMLSEGIVYGYSKKIPRDSKEGSYDVVLVMTVTDNCKLNDTIRDGMIHIDNDHPRWIILHRVPASPISVDDFEQ